jgi:formate/nitrite transporter
LARKKGILIMDSFSPKEVVENYSNVGANKTTMKLGKLLVLGILAGMIIAFGSAATNTAAFAFTNISIIRIVTGMLFPFGLAMVILTGAELFTGNVLISISVFDKKAKIKGMLRNWLIVYIGNLIGSLIVSVGGVYFGQLNYGDGALAMYTIGIAAAKCAMPFSSAFVMGFFCNFLVTLAVIISMTTKDTFGKIAASFVPVAFFVFAGYEHSVANMYYVPAGILASHITSYYEQATALGIDMSNLTTMGFITGNLIPVTLGNIVGGIAFSFIMWYSHKKN